jgi:hypothetical protein
VVKDLVVNKCYVDCINANSLHFYRMVARFDSLRSRINDAIVHLHFVFAVARVNSSIPCWFYLFMEPFDASALTALI